MNNKYMEQAEQALVHTYNRYPIVLDHGEGVYLYDTEGKKYLDFAAGIAVCSLGYGHPEYNKALKEQMVKLLHVSNLFYTAPVVDAAEKLKKASQMDRIFFTNSGTEAIEGALKAARKYAYTKKSGKYEFIAMEHSFHGRSMGAVSVTGTENYRTPFEPLVGGVRFAKYNDLESVKAQAMEHSFHGRSMGAVSVTGTENYRTPFEPLVGGVRFAKYNDLESVKAQITDQTCAIILETVQGEGGIYPAESEFLKEIRMLCDENDILLILDEIQCGMGRTGSMFAWQDYGVRPDIMCMAKAIGNGYT